MNRCCLLIGLITVLGFSISCKKNNETPTSKDSITILYIGDERIFHQDYWGMPAAFWMFLPLVTDVGNETGEIQPFLAESWTHSDDYRIWTVTLRKDIYWHDGVNMTAHDIKFSFDLKKKALVFKNGFECELIDNYTFKLINSKPISQLPSWEVYYPKHLLENLDVSNYYDWDFWKSPIGNGPYKFVRNVPNIMIEVEANLNYFGDTPKIKRAILKFSQNPSLTELLSKNVDVITFAPRDFLFKIDNKSRYTSYYWWHNQIETIFWNHHNILFSEAKVRRALTMAINRAELSKVLNYPNNIPISDVLYSDRQKLTSDFPISSSYNPNKAVQLLKEEGWTDTNGDGTLNKNGMDFQFTLLVGEENKLMSTYIQNNLKKIGVIMDIEIVEQSISNQMMKRKEFDAILTILYNEENELHLIKKYFGENSSLGYNNPLLNKLLDEIEITGDKIKIDSLYKETFSIFKQDIPATFILPKVETHIVSKRIKGLNNLYKADPVWFLESLWIE